MKIKGMIQETPEISVIIPTYNREIFIPQLVQSIKSQSFENFECIIVDDGSMDHTGKLLDNMTARDERFIVKHTSNYGVSHARNVALDIAKGEYITFVDSDDSIPENYLEKLLSRIKSTHVDMVIGSFCRIYEDGRIEKIKYPFESRIHTMEELLPDFSSIQKKYGVFGWCWAKVISRKLVSTIRFDESLKLAEDFDFYLKLYPQIHTVFFDNTCEYGYTDSAENSSMKVNDDDIDYVSQLRIFIRYKKYLEDSGVFCGENEQLVTEQIQNYVYFSIYHCRRKELGEIFKEVYELYCLSDIKPMKRSGLQEIVLWCIRRKKEKTLTALMKTFWIARKMVKGH